MREIVYLHGLGNEKTVDRQRPLVKRWENDNIRTYFFESMWHESESVETKNTRLDEYLDSIDGNLEISASSAGGSLALAAYVRHPERITKLSLISAKFRHPERISRSFRDRTQSFVPMVEQSEQVLDTLDTSDLAKIHTYRPVLDNIISVREMSIEGANNHLMPAVGHAIGIGAALLYFAKPK